MSHDNWMIYGAYGYSGALVVVVEAVKRGHRPLLAGRDEGKVAALGERFGLPWVAFGLGDMALKPPQRSPHACPSTWHGLCTRNRGHEAA